MENPPEIHGRKGKRQHSPPPLSQSSFDLLYAFVVSPCSCTTAEALSIF